MRSVHLLHLKQANAVGLQTTRIVQPWSTGRLSPVLLVWPRMVLVPVRAQVRVRLRGLLLVLLVRLVRLVRLVWMWVAWMLVV
jgi:hypothetical protein